MSVKGALGGIASSIIGNPKKALLILYKGTDDQINTTDIAAKTEAALATAGNAGVKALSMSLGKTFHVLQVQYNPSSIRIMANAEAIPVQYLQKNVDSTIPNQNLRPPSVVLSVDLVFDAVNLKDSFMFEKMRLSVGDAVSAAAALLKKGGYTVQPQTNGLISMIMRDSTRLVTFKWADMAFTGEVNEISARYTMFSVSGKPVRSIVTLNITQAVTSNGDVKYWKNAFDKCFGDENFSGLSGGKSFGSAVQSLFNINF